MKLQLTNKFLHRVRIHGGEFDSSARAMNRAGEKDTLITYERALEAQADLRKFRGSTIERKHMSTKTTFKRVALVAVAALGLGVLSVAPSNAFTQADSLTVSSTTAAVLSTDTATATSAPTATLAFLASAATDSMTITASLVSAPATGTALPYLQLTESTSAVVKNSSNGTLAVGSAQAANGKVYVNTTGGSTATRVSATFKVYLGTSDVAGATVAGTYVVKLTPEVVAGSGTVNAVAQTITFTVTALDTKADATSTSIIARGVSAVGDVDSVTTFSKALTAGGAAVQAATIKLTQKSAITTAVPNESVTVTIAGPGSLSTSATTTGSATGARAISAKNGDFIHVFSDGSSGVATITMTGATSAAVLATEKVTFFGDAATVTATAEKTVIGTGGTAETLLVKVLDSTGVAVTGLQSIGIVSATTANISTNYASTATFDDAKGGYLVTVTGVKAGSAALTATTKASATATTGVDAAAAVTVRVGSILPSTIAVTTDKASYAPGEKATITVVLKDATGLTLADGDYTNIFKTGGIVSSYTLGAGSDSITGTSVVGLALEKKEYTVYMPVTEGDVTFTWIAGSNTNFASTYALTATGTTTVSVSSSGTAAALDAANEATDAANAATDAALAAADAADAATAAAEDASAAVAALAKSVNTALKALKKQITSLTALVNKLLKK